MEAIAFLLVAGAVLMLLEPLFPAYIAACVGLICWAGAVLLTYFRFGFLPGTLTFAGVLTVGLAGIWWYLKRLPASRVGRLVQSDHVTPAETAAKLHLLHQTGTALTPLLPGGVAEIAGERVDVVSTGEALTRGQTVTVVGVEGSRILVQAA